MFMKALKNIAGDNAGATAVEYGLIVSLIVLSIFSALQVVAGETIEMWQHIEAKSSEALNK